VIHTWSLGTAIWTRIVVPRVRGDHLSSMLRGPPRWCDFGVEMRSGKRSNSEVSYERSTWKTRLVETSCLLIRRCNRQERVLWRWLTTSCTRVKQFRCQCSLPSHWADGENYSDVPWAVTNNLYHRIIFRIICTTE